MKKKATIHDIARELNINASTVSRALADSPRVKEKTKKLIQEKAAEMGYSRNHLASNLRTQRTHTIGVIVPNISRHFFSTVIGGMEEIVSEQGYNLIICQSHDSAEREAQLVDTLLANQVDGIILSIATEQSDGSHIQRIEASGKPVVFFDRECKTIQGHNVLIDDFSRAYELTDSLIQNGCCHIVHLGGNSEASIYQDRLRGYKDALEKNNIEFQEDWVFKSRLKQLDGQEIAQQLLTKDKMPDAIFSANDVAAIAAMEVLQKAGIRIPEEIKVFGFSGEPISAYTSPALSTVNQNPNLMGQKTAELLLDQINGTQLPVHNTIIPSEIIIRQSSLKTD